MVPAPADPDIYSDDRRVGVATSPATGFLETSARETWVDAARGFGISLVVFGHVWRGLEKAGIMSADAVFVAVDRAVYSFHMPLLFFVSGLFFYPSLARRTTFDFALT